MKSVFRIFILLFIAGCIGTNTKDEQTNDLTGIPLGHTVQHEFPPFITPTAQYFEYVSNGVPLVDKDDYRLKIYGEIDLAVELTVEDLKKLPGVNQAITVECIGNIATGNLVGTATWKGFSLEYLLDSLGIDPAAKTIKFVCADGYYSTISLEVLRNRNILGALYMNNELIPVKYGYPLRILVPGFYGVKSPAWVTEIEILDNNTLDYWDSDGWKTSEQMGPDTKIFFPPIETRWSVGDTVKIGGAAFGGRRVSAVEISFDNGRNWQKADITNSTDKDFVWVFWSAAFIPEEKGDYIVRSRAANEKGEWQPRYDDAYLDGSNGMPEIHIYVR